MLLFWERGYEGTSVGDLADTLGIGKPSLYAAFGSKEELFYETLDLYQARYGAYFAGDLNAFATAREAFTEILHRNAESQLNPETPSGCFIVLSATVGTPQNAEVRANLSRRRNASRAVFAARIVRGIADGDVPATADPEAIATFYATVINGMSIEARDGASPADLDRIVTGALSAWDALMLSRSVR